MNSNVARPVKIAAFSIFAALGINVITLIVSLSFARYSYIGDSSLFSIIIMIAWGAVAYWILQGNKIARIIYTILFVLNLIISIRVAVLYIKYIDYLINMEIITLVRAVSMGIHIFAIIQLYSNRANAYYSLSSDNNYRSLESQFKDGF